MLNLTRATAIASLLSGQNAAVVATLPQSLAQAASGDPISAGVLAQTAPGLDPVNDVDNLAAAVHFFELPNALTAAQLQAAFGLLAMLPAAPKS